MGLSKVTGRGWTGRGGEASTKSPTRPKPRSLSNVEARHYYNSKLYVLRLVADRMRSRGAPLRETAMRVSRLRNVLKIRVRDMMADRVKAAELPSIKSFEYYVEKYSAQGLSGDELYSKIIETSFTPNPVVNSALGIED